VTGEELEVWNVVEALNATWTQGRADELRGHLHEDFVAITPTDRHRLVGRDAASASWERFCDQARILSWEARDPLVKVFGDAAVVTYEYDLFCEVGGREMHLGGRDMFLLARDAGRWWPVADQFSPYPDVENGVV